VIKQVAPDLNEAHVDAALSWEEREEIDGIRSLMIPMMTGDACGPG
jgi:hypothetical protein